MSAKAKKSSSQRTVYTNSKARRNYTIEESLEAGIILTGTEVKSIRLGHVQINESFARIERGKVLMYQSHIAEYKFGNINNHDPHRVRELLLKKKEVYRLERAIQSGGRTLVPLKLYLKKALVKVEIGLAVGKKLYDKRESLKKKAEMREAERSLKGKNF